MAGSLWAALMGLLQLIVSFFTFIKNALTGVFSGGNQASNSSSGSERQNQTRYKSNMKTCLMLCDEMVKVAVTRNQTQSSIMA